ncbi:hypothetical protein PPL_03203 [Heterostelium album PN500]|uniref:lipoyl(octanoyl) transferase n=1 Tax=Heterostelium pallidum (strain ATCC 26659 / Pp 5 / PN500) TaxID=670386 RepID=D3B482_HETP5|nr:hypothetical protein PPL_03203 [Heterostelium album PN500]EFA84130.1 hypothetical protein PPL_03203 [Heterostelium album PN500]|eukprot:XP_020436247.1 hypothetical protein PPL_03203 [Heterostelium album PN500]
MNIQSSQKLTKLIGYQYLGTIPYRRSLEYQNILVKKRQIFDALSEDEKKNTKEIPDILLLLQHPPTYTNGVRNNYNVATEEMDRLKSLGADYVAIRRGGEITYHGPGQLVGYPIINLRNHGLGLRDYVHRLQDSILDTCSKFDVPCSTSSENIGVWRGNKKIAALGVHHQRYVTSHGFALNCTTDLKWFDHIIPCGLKNKGVTSFMHEKGTVGQTNPEPSVETVVEAYRDSFSKIFNVQLKPLHEIAPYLCLESQEMQNELIET